MLFTGNAGAQSGQQVGITDLPVLMGKAKGDIMCLRETPQLPWPAVKQNLLLRFGDGFKIVVQEKEHWLAVKRADPAATCL